MSQTVTPIKDAEETFTTLAQAQQGWWVDDGRGPESGSVSLASVLENLGEPVYVIDKERKQVFTNFGTAWLGKNQTEEAALALIAYAPAIPYGATGECRVLQRPQYPPALHVRIHGQWHCLGTSGQGHRKRWYAGLFWRCRPDGGPNRGGHY